MKTINKTTTTIIIMKQYDNKTIKSIISINKIK